MATGAPLMMPQQPKAIDNPIMENTFRRETMSDTIFALISSPGITGQTTSVELLKISERAALAQA